MNEFVQWVKNNHTKQEIKAISEKGWGSCNKITIELADTFSDEIFDLLDEAATDLDFESGKKMVAQAAYDCNEKIEKIEDYMLLCLKMAIQVAAIKLK